MKDHGSLVAGLEAGAFAALCDRGVRRRYGAGQTVFCRDDAGDALFVIESGLIEISVTSSQGRKTVFNHMGPGEILGEVAFLDRGRRSADAVALKDSRLVALDRRTVAQFLQDDPDALLDLIGALCAKVRNASDMAENHALSSAPARLARCLLHLGRKWAAPDIDGRIVFEKTFSQSELGELAGIARENVNRHLRSWERAGLVTFDKGRITVDDPDELTRLAEL